MGQFGHDVVHHSASHVRTVRFNAGNPLKGMPTVKDLFLDFALAVAFAAPAKDFTFAQPGEGQGFIAVNFPHCEENRWDKKCRELSIPPASRDQKEARRMITSDQLDVLADFFRYRGRNSLLR